MTNTLDEIDRRILFSLTRDARRTSAPDIAADFDVSAATIRNRIDQLEERGVIQGYHANIDYEKTGGKLTYLFICNTDPPRREYFVRKALEVPGVIHVREVMSGRRNLHIKAIGEDKTDITRISRDLSNLGIDIEEEALLQRDIHNPYQSFGPESASPSLSSNLTNLHELAGDAKVIDVTVAEDAAATGETIQDLSEKGLLREELLIVAIERGEEIIMPAGETLIREGDLVTVLSQQGETEDLVGLFTGERDPDGSRTERPPNP